MPVPAEALEVRLSGLPAGLLVEPGRIEVRFAEAKEALTRLYALAQALGNDFEDFEALVGGERTFERSRLKGSVDRACGQWLPYAFRRRSIITTIARATSTPVAANLVSRVGLDDRDDDVQGWHDGFGELRVECEEENGLMAQQERSSRVMAEPAVVDIAAAGRRRPPEHGGGSRAPVAGGTMIGRGVVIKGNVSGNEDVEVEGEVVGTIELQQHVVTVGPGGRVEAQVLRSRSWCSVRGPGS